MATTKRKGGILRLRRMKIQTNIGSTRNTISTNTVTINTVAQSENPLAVETKQRQKIIIQVKRKVMKMTHGVGDNALVVIVPLTNSFSQHNLPRSTL